MHRYSGFPLPENPLLTVARCDGSCTPGAEQEFTGDFYIISLKNLTAGSIMYGRTKYDHDTGCMIFVKPRQIIQFKDLHYGEDGFVLFIHEDYLNGHFLHTTMSQYSFFDYEVNEALHLSPREKEIMWDLFTKINHEYRDNPDEYSRNITLTHIDSMLNYSQRFYKRQFLNRADLSGKTVSKFNESLTAYFKSGAGLPTVNQMAAQLNLSARYLSDLLKQETGKTTMELIHVFLINEAKNRLKTDAQSIAEIAYELGFENPPYFSRLFKKETGLTPNQFKKVQVN
jgi:AraC family transcriptional regulator, transcriptional activator of pobA